VGDSQRTVGSENASFPPPPKVAVKNDLPRFSDPNVQGLFGDVFFMRPARAPGVGDPDGFSLNDYNTQRNLDAHGRQQVIFFNYITFRKKNQLHYYINCCLAEKRGAMAKERTERESRGRRPYSFFFWRWRKKGSQGHLTHGAAGHTVEIFP
jgi:hypothetical protein